MRIRAFRVFRFKLQCGKLWPMSNTLQMVYLAKLINVHAVGDGTEPRVIHCPLYEPDR